jgi:hypothetical protein
MDKTLETKLVVNKEIEYIVDNFSDKKYSSPFDRTCLVLNVLYRAKEQKLFPVSDEDFKGIDIFHDTPLSFSYIVTSIDKRSLSLLNASIERLMSIDKNEFMEIYPEVVDFVIEKYCGFGQGEFFQPHSLTQLVSALITSTGCKSMYNPFAGTASYALKFNGAYFGQEINERVHDIGLLRLSAYGVFSDFYENADSVSDWNDYNAEAIVSTPPFGMRGNYLVDLKNYADTVEEFVIAKYLKSNARFGFFVVPRSFCFKSSGFAFALRKNICEANNLAIAINLPQRIFSYSGVTTSLLVFDKQRTKSDEVLMIDAGKMSVTFGKETHIDVAKVIKAINESTEGVSATIKSSSLFQADCSFDASVYMTANLCAGPGQKVYMLAELLNPAVGERIDVPVDNMENVLSSDDFADNVVKLRKANNSNHASQPVFRFQGKHFVLSTTGKVYIHDEDTAFHVGSTLRKLVFNVNEELVTPEYLALCLLSNDAIQKGFFGSAVWRTNPKLLLKYQIVIEEDIKKQKRIVERIKRNYAESELKRLGIRNVGGDISHMLGMAKDTIGDLLTTLLTSETLSPNDKQTVMALSDNFGYMRRIIDNFGADYSNSKERIKEVSFARLVSDYLKSWKNIGYSRIFQLEQDIHIGELTTVKCNADLIRVILDEALKNAYKHGFEQLNLPDNKVKVSCEVVSYDGKEYVCLSIANNGKPLDSNFTIEDFAARGVYSDTTGTSGIGGSHIYTIVKKYGGWLNISASKYWSFILDILLPVYNLGNSKIESEYGSKCI